MQEIDIMQVDGFKIGHDSDHVGGTGVTVILPDEFSPTGVDIRGGGPASRESNLLSPLSDAKGVHAILLSGGSAFGLDSAGGVMKFLEERDIGFDVGVTKVPLVCQSSLFDLVVADVYARPSQEHAYRACENASYNSPEQGNVGAGTGCSVGKVLGMEYAMKGGIGTFAVSIGELKVGAIVAVNALGDIFDIDTNEPLAGILSEDKKGRRSSAQELYNMQNRDLFTGNTTIGAILTNAKFDKSLLCKIAGMAHNGYARTINPVHTTADGDSIYAMSTGNIISDVNVVGTLSAYVMGKAVNNAIRNAKSAYSLLAFSDM